MDKSPKIWEIEDLTNLKNWTDDQVREAIGQVRQMHDNYNDLITKYNSLLERCATSEDGVQQQADLITSLEAQIAWKDIVIEHLETCTTATRGDTPDLDILHNSKSTKLPDPPVFTSSSDVDFNDWLSRMKTKLNVNRDHYPTELV